MMRGYTLDRPSNGEGSQVIDAEGTSRGSNSHLFNHPVYSYWGVIKRLQGLRFHTYHVGIFNHYAVFFDFATNDFAGVHDLKNAHVGSIQKYVFYCSRTGNYIFRAETKAAACIYRTLFTQAGEYHEDFGRSPALELPARAPAPVPPLAPSLVVPVINHPAAVPIPDCPPAARSVGRATRERPPITETMWRSWGHVARDGQPVEEATWHASFNAEGRLFPGRWDALRKAIFAGGLSPSLRAAAWPFLVGFYSPTSTEAERVDIRRRRALEYDAVRCQWWLISESQASRFAAFRERRDRIERDVPRTDQDDPANGQLLTNILLSYALYNFDLAYCQGMSDIASTLLMLLQEEVLTFWCFVHTMEVLGGNFESDGIAIKAQLDRVGHILTVVDPTLSFHMASIQPDHMHCAFRWILVRFRREFPYPAILTLWEALWTAEANGYGPDFHLWMCVCILHRERRAILERRMRADDLFRHTTGLSGTLDADDLVVYTTVLAEVYKSLV